jgi:hypothetical protein
LWKAFALLLRRFLPPNPCANAKFLARRIVFPNERRQDLHDEAWRLRVAAAFFADAERSAAERLADAWPPSRPPFRDEAWDSDFPRPDPLFFPPPLSLLTVAHALRSASSSGTPRDS